MRRRVFKFRISSLDTSADNYKIKVKQILKKAVTVLCDKSYKKLSSYLTDGCIDYAHKLISKLILIRENLKVAIPKGLLVLENMLYDFKLNDRKIKIIV